jgi:phage repressor protein C with HTH and peptisase S24 domain
MKKIPMKTYAERLRYAIDERAGGNQSEVARQIGTKPQNISYLCKNAKKGSTMTTAIAKALGISSDWLESGIGDMDVKNDSQNTAVVLDMEEARSDEYKKIIQPHKIRGSKMTFDIDEDVIDISERQEENSDLHIYARTRYADEDILPKELIKIPIRDVRMSATEQTLIPEYKEINAHLTHSKLWMTDRGLKAEYLFAFKVKGDSNEPVLYENDYVIVNTEECDIDYVVDGKLYLLLYRNEARIRRIFKLLSGAVILKCSNPEYLDETVTPELFESHVRILGRIRDKRGDGGL